SSFVHGDTVTPEMYTRSLHDALPILEATCVLDRFLDEAMRANLSTVRIIHGKGTGALRSAVQEDLRRNKFVKKFRLGTYGEGEEDRKSTRLNSSHVSSSYAVFCLKKK